MARTEVSIPSATEILLEFYGETDTEPRTVQKYVRVQDKGSKKDTFSYKMLLEVGSLIHNSPDLRKRYRNEIEAIGWVRCLFHRKILRGFRLHSEWIHLSLSFFSFIMCVYFFFCECKLTYNLRLKNVPIRRDANASHREKSSSPTRLRV